MKIFDTIANSPIWNWDLFLAALATLVVIFVFITIFGESEEPHYSNAQLANKACILHQGVRNFDTYGDVTCLDGFAMQY